MHEARQDGKGGGEVIPGERQLCVDSCELQDENEKSDEGAEAPGEHGPYPVGRSDVSFCRCQTKTHTREDSRCYSNDAHRLGK